VAFGSVVSFCLYTVKKLSRVVTWQRTERMSNSWPRDRESIVLSNEPPSLAEPTNRREWNSGFTRSGWSSLVVDVLCRASRSSPADAAAAVAALWSSREQTQTCVAGYSLTTAGAPRQSCLLATQSLNYKWLQSLGAALTVLCWSRSRSVQC